MKVFISSTYSDLVEYRKVAIKVMNRFKLIPVGMEFFGSRADEPKVVCDEEVLGCELFIGIYAHRYGFVPEDEDKSITQLEYELAKKEEKPRLCFCVDHDFDWKRRFIEFKKEKELGEFLAQMDKDVVRTTFTTPENFEVNLTASLSDFLSKYKKAPPPSETLSTAPRPPYIAHPYPLPAGFTGRRAELDMLCQWVEEAPEPVLVLEAIGGMGKSALAWVWLQKEFIQAPPRRDVAGVFWWSFYEGDFDAFLRCLWTYVTGSKDSPDIARLNAALFRRRFVLVLDGLERALRGYAGMGAMYRPEPAGGEEWERRMREPVHPRAAPFLTALSQGRCRVLITTRLMPAPLEALQGVKPHPLSGLSGPDTVAFFQDRGIAGTRAELLRAAAVYHSHPLMLTLLASALQKKRRKDITDAYGLKLIDKEQPAKLLERSFQLLSPAEKKVALRIAVFRSPFGFEVARALFPRFSEEALWQILQELRGLGFLFYEEKAERFDFHPVPRAFLYERLKERHRKGAHQQAAHYFKALPHKENVVTPEDLHPVIELYHHLVKANQLDEARELFRDRIGKPAYYQLSAYDLIIDLLQELFPAEGGGLPRLEREADQAWTLNTLANTYALSGRPAGAVPLYLLLNKLLEKNNEKKNLAIGLGNVGQIQFSIGGLSAAAAHLRKSIALCREIKEEFHEAWMHKELGRILACRGRGEDAEEEWKRSTAYFEKENHFQGLGVYYAYRSHSALLSARLCAAQGEGTRCRERGREAVALARKALQFAEEDTKKRYPHPMDFVRAYWLLGEALLVSRGDVSPAQAAPLEVPFYDPYFREIRHSEPLRPGAEAPLARRCLEEALRRCRKTNMIIHEPDILLSLARLESQTRPGALGPCEALLQECAAISRRAGYRLKLADLHLFCAQTLTDIPSDAKPVLLLGSDRAAHLDLAQKYARDVSEFKDLYQSSDPDFYKDIPQYDQLKKGLTEEERIKNGYYILWQTAEALKHRA